jgi:hypothetical protein
MRTSGVTDSARSNPSGSRKSPPSARIEPRRLYFVCVCPLKWGIGFKNTL